jgi:hypothetical protein
LSGVHLPSSEDTDERQTTNKKARPYGQALIGSDDYWPLKIPVRFGKDVNKKDHPEIMLCGGGRFHKNNTPEYARGAEAMSRIKSVENRADERASRPPVASPRRSSPFRKS